MWDSFEHCWNYVLLNFCFIFSKTLQVLFKILVCFICYQCKLVKMWPFVKPPHRFWTPKVAYFGIFLSFAQFPGWMKVGSVFYKWPFTLQPKIRFGLGREGRSISVICLFNNRFFIVVYRLVLIEHHAWSSMRKLTHF